MIYAITRALSAALAFGFSAQLPGIATVAVALLWALVAFVLTPTSLDFLWIPLFFEIALGLWMGLAASLPIVAARLGAALGDDKLAAPYNTLGALFAGTVLFAANVDHILLRAFFKSFIKVPPGYAQSAIQMPTALVELLEMTLQFSLRIGAVGIVALLLVDLGNSILSRLFPGQVIAIPREPVKMLGLYTSLGAVAYVILQVAQESSTFLQR